VASPQTFHHAVQGRTGKVLSPVICGDRKRPRPTSRSLLCSAPPWLYLLCGSLRPCENSNIITAFPRQLAPRKNALYLGNKMHL
jgi:hypothetical protein